MEGSFGASFLWQHLVLYQNGVRVLGSSRTGAAHVPSACTWSITVGAWPFNLGPFDGDTSFSKEESKYSLFLNLPFNFDIEIYASEDSGINRRYCNG